MSSFMFPSPSPFFCILKFPVDACSFSFGLFSLKFISSLQTYLLPHSPLLSLVSQKSMGSEDAVFTEHILQEKGIFVLGLEQE